jgi:hypothetical protein
VHAASAWHKYRTDGAKRDQSSGHCGTTRRTGFAAAPIADHNRRAPLPHGNSVSFGLGPHPPMGIRSHLVSKPFVKYLLGLQLADGSWHVHTRAMGFQPYFESGFPHGHDQWISAAGTAWAIMALAPVAEPAKMASR